MPLVVHILSNVRALNQRTMAQKQRSFSTLYQACILVTCLAVCRGTDGHVATSQGDSKIRGQSCHEHGIVVSVKQGDLRGSVQRLLNGQTFYSFKGIPYAMPPVGQLRFKAPLPARPWTGVWDATQHGPVCSQFDPNTQTLKGSENCLFLNVYTPSLQLNAKIPVMVYIYGGGFSSGSGNQELYGPEFLLQHDVIVVTLNYRLEVLGFLSLDIPEVPGNAGMKDQVLALRWVKANIAQFGGDPDNVTIFGESAGSVAVTHHLISPMSKGLFHKAIAQSGVCIDDSGTTTGAKERAFRVAKMLGKETTDTEELLRFLRSVPASKLANVTSITETSDEKLRGIPMRFGPVIEMKFGNSDAFISENPLNTVISEKVNKVPLIIGYNSAEGLIMLTDQLKKAERLNTNSSYLVPRELVQKLSAVEVAELGQRIMKVYTKDKGLGNDTAEGIVEMRTDMHFAYNIQRFTHFYSKLNVPVHLYMFDYNTELNIVKHFLGLSDMAGACHADDLFYFFYNEQNKELVNNKRLRRIVFELTKMWTDFAKTGKPTPGAGAGSWPEWAGRGPVLLGGQLARAEPRRLRFWNTMYCDAGVPCITD